MPTADEVPVRERILSAAFSAFMEAGYAATSTLEIATRAKVSKRELYAEFGSKHGILQALIASTAERMQAPLMPPEMGDRHAFSAAKNLSYRSSRPPRTAIPLSRPGQRGSRGGR